MKHPNLLKSVLILCVLGSASHLMYAQTYINHNVNQPAALQADAGVDTLVCVNDSAMLGGAPTAINGTAPFTFAWTPATGLSNASIANPMASPAATTTYIVAITDSNNCVQEDTILLTIDPCIGIQENISGLSVSIFPNPNEGAFSLLISGNSELRNMLFEIINPAGQVVHTEQINEAVSRVERKIGLANYAKGIYLVKVSGSNTNVVQTFIVQ